MNFLTDIKNELIQEAAVTRKFLAKVDFDKADFKPHSKSENFGRLAIHVAEIIAWWKNVIEQNELNFINFEPADIKTTDALLTYFDFCLNDSVSALENANPDILHKQWSMIDGNGVLFALNKKEVLRKFCMNHLIHHRAQLGVYLRLLDIDVPATYGPSADSMDISLVRKFT